MPGVTELAIVLVVVLVFFGAGKLPSVMGEIGKGFKAIRGIGDDISK